MTNLRAAAAIALVLSTVNPDFHPFCVLDMSISYPYRDAKVGLGLFIFIAIIAPALIIAFVSLYFFPASETPRQGTREHLWRPKLWEMNAGLLGLGVSLATATVIFTGVKNLTGKPRPNFLQRCQPDLDNIAAHTIGGFGQKVSALWVMVDQEICQQPDKKWLNDGFRSFPSGYATISFAGLWYLTLYLCTKFNVTVPNGSSHDSQVQRDIAGEPLLQDGDQGAGRRPHPEEAAAQPAFLLPLPYVPLGLAIFISGTRYFDFRNHGFDVLAGAAIGTATAWFGFRWYHPPLSAHARSAWGPRRSTGAFHHIGNVGNQG